MIKQWLHLLICALMFSPLAIVRAQETWSAWMYSPTSGDMTLIDGNGYILEQIKLPLPNRYLAYSFDVSVSASGQRVVYIATDTIHDERKLMIYHAERRRVLLEYQLPAELLAETLSFADEDTNLFNDGELAIAFGYSLQGGGWQLPIIDIQTGQAILILRAGAPNAADLSSSEGVTPIVRRFDGTSVIFTMVNAQNLVNDSTIQTYSWNTQTNAVEVVNTYRALDSDTYLPSDEIIMPLSDTNFADDGYFNQPNALYVYDPIEKEPFAFIANADRGYFWPRFIQNGERVLVGIFDKDGKTAFVVIGRDGTEQAQWNFAENRIISAIRGTADGFAYAADTIDPGGQSHTTLYAVNTFVALDEGKPLFRSDDGSQLRLVWLNDARQWAAPRSLWARAGEVSIATTPTPSPAQDLLTENIREWQAWIYEDNGQAVLINQDGEILDKFLLAFPGSAGDSSPQSMPLYLTASHNGELLAGVFSENGIPRYLQVIDTTLNTASLTYTLPKDGSTSIPSHTIDRAPRATIFNQDDSALAFGFGLGEAGWQISVLDVRRGTTLAELRHDSPPMQSLGTDTGFGVVPVIQRFDGDNVYFTVHPAGALEPPYLSFKWNIATGAVSPNLIYANAQTDSFAPTGEVIMAMIDLRLNNTAKNFSYGQLNALHIYDPLTGTRFPFYNSAELWLFRPIFVQNGERILVGGSNPSGAFTGWAVLERDGRVAGVLPLAGGIWDAAGVGDGFIYIPRDDAANTPNLDIQFVETRAKIDAGTLLYRAPRAGHPQIVWTGYAAKRSPVSAWAQMAPPILVIGGAASETAPRQLVIGGAATVRTTGISALLVRVGPGRDFDVATRLNSGTRVTLVEGPRAVTGENWWKIRTPSGVEGWVIDTADGVKTLVPD